MSWYCKFSVRPHSVHLVPSIQDIGCATASVATMSPVNSCTESNRTCDYHNTSNTTSSTTEDTKLSTRSKEKHHTICEIARSARSSEFPIPNDIAHGVGIAPVSSRTDDITRAPVAMVCTGREIEMGRTGRHRTIAVGQLCQEAMRVGGGGGGDPQCTIRNRQCSLKSCHLVSRRASSSTKDGHIWSAAGERG